MRLALASLGLLAGAAGCQAFVGIEDAQQHLPRLDGNYLVAIERPRPSNASVIDVIRMQGTASLDSESRTLNLAMSILPFGGGTQLSETTISGIEFPDDSDEVSYTIDISIPNGALNPTPPPETADTRVNVNVIFIAEADYSFCAKPVQPDPEPDPPLLIPSVGSVLVDSFSTLPSTSDSNCDDELRQ